MLTLPHVPPEEAAPFYAEFLNACPDGRVEEYLQKQLPELESLCRHLSETESMYRYAENKWTVKEVVGHLLDSERVFAYRLLRISRNDATPLPGFDEEGYAVAGQFNDRAVSNLVHEFSLQRLSTIALAKSIPPESWTNVGSANGYPISARALVYVILGHTRHHLDLLKNRYDLPSRRTQ